MSKKMDRVVTTLTIEEGAHSTLDAILNRWSVTKFQAECPPQNAIQQLLDAAVLAPNHHLNQPWRFVVLTGHALDLYGDLLAERLTVNLENPSSPQSIALLEAERRKPLRAPVLIVVASVRTSHPKALRLEDVAATAAAVQNILLAAPSLGLGAYWRTGKSAEDLTVKSFFGLAEADDIVAFVYVGYPAAVRAPIPRKPAKERTAWLGWGA